MFDVNKLTLGELARIEDLSGLSVAAIGDEASPKGKLLAAMAFVQMRRDGRTDVKWPDALALTFDEANAILGLNDADEPDLAEATHYPRHEVDAEPAADADPS